MTASRAATWRRSRSARVLSSLARTLLVDDPDSPGRLRLHRLVGVEDGGLRLQGDANPTPDPQLVDPSAVHGVGALRLPALGLPVLWAAEGRTLPLAGGAALPALVVALSLAHRTPEDDAPEDDAPEDDAHEDDAHEDDAHEDDEEPAAGGSWRAARVAVPALAVFTATTVNDANSWASARYYTCTSAGASAPGYLALQETAGPIAANSGIYAGSVNGRYSSSGVTYRVPGPACGGDGRAVRLDGGSGHIYTTTTLADPQTFSVQVWFATTTDEGGKLIGFGNGTNGAASSQYDRHVYMTNSGKLTFGVYDGTPETTTSPRSYNDGAWHQMTATFSPGTGLRLYVDGVEVASRKQATAAEPFTGFWRVGYDAIGDAWPASPRSEHFAGSVAHVSVYVTVLSAADVAAQYRAAG